MKILAKVIYLLIIIPLWIWAGVSTYEYFSGDGQLSFALVLPIVIAIIVQMVAKRVLRIGKASKKETEKEKQTKNEATPKRPNSEALEKRTFR